MNRSTYWTSKDPNHVVDRGCYHCGHKITRYFCYTFAQIPTWYARPPDYAVFGVCEDCLKKVRYQKEQGFFLITRDELEILIVMYQ
jgi:hypothetical protein